MVVVVIGGTGSCGKHFVHHALGNGFVVRLLTRRSSGVTKERFSWADHENLELIQGDLVDLAVLQRVCNGAEAVVSLAGPPAGAETSVMPEAIRNTVTAMRENSVKRLIVQTGGFVKLKGERGSILEAGAREAFAWMMKEKATLAGNDAVALFLEEECPDIDWTITRPGMLSDKGVQGVVEPAFDYGPGMPADHPSKIDLTRWYIDLLDDQKSFHKAAESLFVKSSKHIYKNGYQCFGFSLVVHLEITSRVPWLIVLQMLMIPVSSQGHQIFRIPNL